MSNFYDRYVKDAWREPHFDMYKKFSLAGKVGMVTGGGGGIGRNTAAAPPPSTPTGPRRPRSRSWRATWEQRWPRTTFASTRFHPATCGLGFTRA